MTTTNTAAASLLPCPFCGGPVELEQPMGESRRWGVVCRNTINRGGTCAIEQIPSASSEAAIDRWNRRPAHTPQADAAPSEAKRGTDAQILFERELTVSAINGAMAFGHQNTNPPPSDDHWLAPFWKIGRKQAELRAAIAAGGAQEAADTVSLTGAQLLEAFQFVAPDHPNDADQLECEVTIQRGNGHDGPGLYCWITEYPEEGAIRLDGAPTAASNGEQ